MYEHYWIDATSGDILFEAEVEKGIVIPEKLPSELKKLFLDGSRAKEEAAIKGSLRPLSEKEAIHVETCERDLIINSRWLDVWKAKDVDEPNGLDPALGVPSHLHPKSRWILQGFQDPALLDIQRQTPSSDGSELLWFLQVAADHHMEVGIGD
eukprot:2591623-Amphidinium_carterae.1